MKHACFLCLFLCLAATFMLSQSNPVPLINQTARIATEPTPNAPVVMLSPRSLSFSTQLVGTTSVAKIVTLTNTGSDTLDITSITASGDFAQTNTCGSSVGAGASCKISVTFAPLTKGTLAGSVSVVDNAPGSPQTASLTGTGTVVTLFPVKLNFGSQQVGAASLAQEIKLTNGGAAALTITAIKISGANAGDFAETNTCGSSVAGGASCAISVTFTPAATGPRSAAISITDNGGGSPQKVSLAGTGANLQADSLSVTISGLPNGTNGRVTVTGPGGTWTLTQTGALGNV